jgi:disulfide bond formation protein DsbB
MHLLCIHPVADLVEDNSDQRNEQKERNADDAVKNETPNCRTTSPDSSARANLPSPPGPRQVGGGHYRQQHVTHATRHHASDTAAVHISPPPHDQNVRFLPDRASLADMNPMGTLYMRRIALAGALAAAVALGIALASQHFLGLIPCALCLRERWPYRVAILIGLVAAILPPKAVRPVCWLLLPAYLAAAAAAFVHVGVEQHWWPSPLPECTAPDLSGLSPAERFARLPLRPTKSCEDPDYLIPSIPVTFAQANLAYALIVGTGLTLALVRAPRRPA